MSPPVQTTHSRKRFYFSVFYTVVPVFAIMNVLNFWTILVPHDQGHLPGGAKDESALFWAFGPGRCMARCFDGGYLLTSALVEDFFTSDGWFPPFCVLNLWGVTALIAILEILVLSSVKRPVVRAAPHHLADDCTDEINTSLSRATFSCSSSSRDGT